MIATDAARSVLDTLATSSASDKQSNVQALSAAEQSLATVLVQGPLTNAALPVASDEAGEVLRELGGEAAGTETLVAAALVLREIVPREPSSARRGLADLKQALEGFASSLEDGSAVEPAVFLKAVSEASRRLRKHGGGWGTDYEFKSSDLALGMEQWAGSQLVCMNSFGKNGVVGVLRERAGPDDEKRLLGRERRKAARKDNMVTYLHRPGESLVAMQDNLAMALAMWESSTQTQDSDRVALGFGAAMAAAAQLDLRDQRAHLRQRKALSSCMAVLASQAQAQNPDEEAFAKVYATCSDECMRAVSDEWPTFTQPMGEVSRDTLRGILAQDKSAPILIYGSRLGKNIPFTYEQADQLIEEHMRAQGSVAPPTQKEAEDAIYNEMGRTKLSVRTADGVALKPGMEVTKAQAAEVFDSLRQLFVPTEDGTYRATMPLLIQVASILAKASMTLARVLETPIRRVVISKMATAAVPADHYHGERSIKAIHCIGLWLKKARQLCGMSGEHSWDVVSAWCFDFCLGPLGLADTNGDVRNKTLLTAFHLFRAAAFCTMILRRVHNLEGAGTGGSMGAAVAMWERVYKWMSSKCAGGGITSSNIAELVSSVEAHIISDQDNLRLNQVLRSIVLPAMVCVNEDGVVQGSDKAVEFGHDRREGFRGASLDTKDPVQRSAERRSRLADSQQAAADQRDSLAGLVRQLAAENDEKSRDLEAALVEARDDVTKAEVANRLEQESRSLKAALLRARVDLVNAEEVLGKASAALDQFDASQTGGIVGGVPLAPRRVAGSSELDEAVSRRRAVLGIVSSQRGDDDMPRTAAEADAAGSAHGFAGLLGDVRVFDIGGESMMALGMLPPEAIDDVLDDEDDTGRPCDFYGVCFGFLAGRAFLDEGHDLRAALMRVHMGVNAQQVTRGRLSADQEAVAVSCRALGVCDSMHWTSNEQRMVIAPMKIEYHPFAIESDFAEPSSRAIVQSPFRLVPTASAYRHNRCDNIFTSLHSLGQGVTAFHRQLNDVIPGRFHVKGVAGTPDQCYAFGHVFNRSGTILELIPAVGETVASGLGAVHCQRILRKLPATVAVLNTAEAGAFTAEAALSYIDDQDQRTTVSAAVTRVRATAKVARANPGAYTGFAGFAGCTVASSESLKDGAAQEISVTLAAILTTRDAFLSRWRASPSARTFVLANAHRIQNYTLFFEAYNAVKTRATRSIISAQIRARAQGLRQQARRNARSGRGNEQGGSDSEDQ